MKLINVEVLYKGVFNVRFADFFAGIGGFRLGLEAIGGECIFSCEIDEFAIQTYEANFDKISFKDITEVKGDLLKEIPPYDLFVAGFPCQPFSVCGRKEGFMDETRGTLFFDILRVLDATKPQAILLENVAYLVHHDKKRTFRIIKESLEKLGYKLFYKVLNSKNYNIPQNRERIFIVGFLNHSVDFKFPVAENMGIKTVDILENRSDFIYLDKSKYTLINNPKVSPNGMKFVGYLNKNIRKRGIREGTLHLSRVHKQPNRIYDANYIHPCLCAGESSGRYHILTEHGVRKLTLLECFRLQGFPDEFKKIVSTTQLYKQIGNSVSVPVISAIGKEIKFNLMKLKSVV